MHLVFLNQYYPPDAAPTGVMLENLVEQLLRDGHEVSVLCAAGGYAGKTQDDKTQDARQENKDPNIEGPTSNIERRTQEDCGRELERCAQASSTATHHPLPPIPDPRSSIPDLPTLRIIRIRATRFGRGTFAGKLLDYVSYYAGVSWKLLTLRPAPGRIVALTTPPYLSVLARLISKFRGADHAHWVMDLYPDVLAAHGMLDERGLVYRMLAGLARWGFGGTRCAALLTLGPDMAERVGKRVISYQLSDKTQETLQRVHWVPLWGSGKSVISDQSSGKTQDNKTQDARQEAEINSNIEHRTEEDCGEELTHSAAASLATIHDPQSAIDALALRRTRGWNDDDLVVMYSGNMGLGHRFEEVLAAAGSPASRLRISDDGLRIEEKDENALFFHSKFKILHSKSSSSALRFVFFGGGKRREEIARFVRENPGGAVELHDYAPADQLSEHLQSADVHLASLDPAWTGTMVPSKVQGIFSAGRPVIFIGSERSSIGQWVLESGGGWVVAPGDVAGLLSALTEASDPPTRMTRGHAAKAFAGEHFQQARNVARVAAILTRAR